MGSPGRRCGAIIKKAAAARAPCSLAIWVVAGQRPDALAAGKLRRQCIALLGVVDGSVYRATAFMQKIRDGGDDAASGRGIAEQKAQAPKSKRATTHQWNICAEPD